MGEKYEVRVSVSMRKLGDAVPVLSINEVTLEETSEDWSADQTVVFRVVQLIDRIKYLTQTRLDTGGDDDELTE